jgi:hypothetical protein
MMVKPTNPTIANANLNNNQLLSKQEPNPLSLFASISSGVVKPKMDAACPNNENPPSQSSSSSNNNNNNKKKKKKHHGEEGVMKKRKHHDVTSSSSDDDDASSSSSSQKPSRFHRKMSNKKPKSTAAVDQEGQQRAASQRLETLQQSTNVAAVAAAAPLPSQVLMMGSNPRTNGSLQSDYDQMLLNAHMARDRERAALDFALLSGGLQQNHQAQQARHHHQQQQRFLAQIMAMEGGILNRQHPAALEGEEMKVEAVRRHREQQLLMNMSSRDNQQLLLNRREDILLRNNGFLPQNVAAGFSRFDQMQPGGAASLAQQLAAAGNNNLALQQSMLAKIGGAPVPSSSFQGLNAFQNQFMLQNPGALGAASAASAKGMSFRSSAAGTGTGKSPSFGPVTSPDTRSTPAKRLAPARGVFNKSIKSSDDVIDSLARANARFYKNVDNKKAAQRFRSYQCEQWTEKYQELLQFRGENGNW